MQFLSIDPAPFIENFPKSIKEFREWIILKSVNSIMPDINKDEYESQLREVVEDPEYINQVLNYNPRILYDFLDDNGIYISIIYQKDMKRFSVVDSVSLISSNHTSRMEAEIEGFHISFKELEMRLL